MNGREFESVGVKVVSLRIHQQSQKNSRKPSKIGLNVSVKLFRLCLKDERDPSHGEDLHL
jgi:hypothetical protein